MNKPEESIFREEVATVDEDRVTGQDCVTYQESSDEPQQKAHHRPDVMPRGRIPTAMAVGLSKKEVEDTNKGRSSVCTSNGYTKDQTITQST